jgi:NAD(P)-dependent dehydrogenase (short-subunit alcohol dehydrogenase family)
MSGSRTVVVTGGAKGIGKAVVGKFAAHAINGQALVIDGGGIQA